MWRSEAPSNRAGFTLFEVLISLVILAAITGIAATALRPPSPAMRLAQMQAELTQRAALTRTQAVRQGYALPFALPSCTEDAIETRFFPNGTALRASGCLSVDGIRRSISIDPITARLTLETPQ